MTPILADLSIRIECPYLQIQPTNTELFDDEIKWSLTPINYLTTMDINIYAQSETATRPIFLYYADYTPVRYEYKRTNAGFTSSTDMLYLSIGNLPKDHGYEWIISSFSSFNDYTQLLSSNAKRPNIYTKMTFANQDEIYIQNQNDLWQPLFILTPDSISSQKIYAPALPLTYCCQSPETTPPYNLSTLTEIELILQFPVIKATSGFSTGVSTMIKMFPKGKPYFLYENEFNSYYHYGYEILGATNSKISQTPPNPLHPQEKKKYMFQFSIMIRTDHPMEIPYVITLNGTRSRIDIGKDDETNLSGFEKLSYYDDTNCYADVDLSSMPWIEEPKRFILPSKLDINRGIVIEFDTTEQHRIPKQYYITLTCPHYTITSTNEDRLHTPLQFVIEPYHENIIYYNQDEMAQLYALTRTSEPLGQFCYESYQYNYKTITNALSPFTTIFQQLYHFPIHTGLQFKWELFEIVSFIILNMKNIQCTFTTTAIYTDNRDHVITIPCNFESFISYETDPIESGVQGINGIIDWSPQNNQSPYQIEDLIALTLQIQFSIIRTLPHSRYFIKSIFTLPTFNPVTEDSPTKYMSDFGPSYRFIIPKRHAYEQMVVELQHSSNFKRYDYTFNLIFPNITTSIWESEYNYVLYTNITLQNNQQHKYFHPIVPKKSEIDCIITSTIETDQQYNVVPYLIPEHGLIFPMKNQKYQFTPNSNITITCPGWGINMLYNTQQTIGPFEDDSIVKQLITFTFQTYKPETYPILSLDDTICIDDYITSQELYTADYDTIRQVNINHKSSILTTNLATKYYIELTDVPYYTLSLNEYQFSFEKFQIHGLICTPGQTQSVITTIIGQEEKYNVQHELIFQFKPTTSPTSGICELDGNFVINFGQRIVPGPDINSLKLLFILNIEKVVSPSITISYTLHDDYSWYRYQPNHNIVFQQAQQFSTNNELIIQYMNLTTPDTLRRKLFFTFTPTIETSLGQTLYLTANSTNSPGNIFTLDTTTLYDDDNNDNINVDDQKCTFIQYKTKDGEKTLEGDINFKIITDDNHHALSFKLPTTLHKDLYTTMDCTTSKLTLDSKQEISPLYSQPITYVLSRAGLPTVLSLDADMTYWATSIVHKSIKDDHQHDGGDDDEDKDQELEFTTFPTIPITQYPRSLGFNINNLPIDVGTKFNLTMKINNANIVPGNYHVIRTNFTCIKDGLTASTFKESPLNLDPSITAFNYEKHYIQFTTHIDFGTCVVDAKTTSLELGFDIAVYDINITNGVTYDFKLKTRLHDDETENKGGETIYHPPQPLSLPTAPILSAAAKMTYTNTTTPELGNITITRFYRHFSPIELPNLSIDLNSIIRLSSNGTRINNDLFDPKSFFELLPNKHNKDDKLCQIYDLKKEKKVYGKVVPIQDKSNKTLSFDFTSSSFQRILKGDSIGIDCPNWFIRAAAGTRNQTFTYTISTLTSFDESTKTKDQTATNSISWIMEPFGTGPDEDFNPPKPPKKSHKLVIILVILFIIIALACGVIYYLKFYHTNNKNDVMTDGLLDGDDYATLN